MPESSPPITFDRWIELFFMRPVRMWNGSRLPPAVAVDYMTRLDENAWSILSGFPDARVVQGLRGVFIDGSEYPSALLDESIPWHDRNRCIRSLYLLFEQYFARKCRPVSNEPMDGNEIDSLCFMWWDLFPSMGDPTSNRTIDQVDRALLEVIQDILKLDSEACWHSALHGLGHWQVSYPSEVARSIDEFLNDHPHIDSRLREYALSAREGNVM